MLQTIAERFPDVKVSYTGTDIDEKFCEQARELLGSVKNVEVEIIVEDYQEIDPSKFNIPPCDLVLAIHVFYYMRDITKALVDAQKFRKQDGMYPSSYIIY
jgi:ubiquinone/menaquinone biosynthesis C-methylase UbiE